MIPFANSLFNTNGTLNYEEDGSKVSVLEINERRSVINVSLIFAQESKKCEKQIKEEEQTEFKKFKNGPYVRQALLEISQRLGFTETIEFGKIQII